MFHHHTITWCSTQFEFEKHEVAATIGDVFEKSPIFAAGKKTINKKWEPLPHRIHGFSVYLPSSLPLKINEI